MSLITLGPRRRVGWGVGGRKGSAEAKNSGQRPRVVLDVGGGKGSEKAHQF